MPIYKETLSTLPSVRQLRAFVAVYHLGSLSAAAQQLALTQPAITMLLRELETRLSLKLFDRSSRSLRRTEAARLAIVHAERVLAELSAMTSTMSRLSRLCTGHVRIAATATVAQWFLPYALRIMTERHPGILVQIEEVAPGDFVETLLAGRADFGVGTLETPVAGLMENVLVREPLVAAAARPGPCDAGGPISWKQLESLPLVTVRPGYGIRSRIDDAAQRAGIRLCIVHEVSLWGTAIALANQGLGVIVAPRSLIADQAGLAMRKLQRPVVERVTSLVRQRENALSPAAAALFELMLEIHKAQAVI